MDVDGTMTDGSMYFSESGEAMKRFSVRDGMGIELARRAGLQIAILTSEVTDIVTRRAAKLKVEHVILGSRSKQNDLKLLVKKVGTVLEKVVFVESIDFITVEIQLFETVSFELTFLESSVVIIDFGAVISPLIFHLYC